MKIKRLCAAFLAAVLLHERVFDNRSRLYG